MIEYDNVCEIKIDSRGSLRLYRPRSIWNIVRCQDIFHPAGEWHSVELLKNGRCCVRFEVKAR